MVLRNSYLLSGLYLCVGILTEELRKVWPTALVQRLSFTLDSPPWRLLERLGLMDQLRTAYVVGRVTPFEARLLFEGITVGIIFALALVIGSVLWAVQRVGLGRSG
jgi:hypothetical protein